MSRMMTRSGRVVTTLLLAAMAVAQLAPPALAGHGFFRNQSVGGISINAEGVLARAEVKDIQMWKNALSKDLEKVPGGLEGKTEIRKISLKKLEAELNKALKNLGKIPDEVKYLAGIQRIEYLLVYPEKNDIVLAGPGEGWKVNEQGAVVGVTTGLPVIQLDDLLVALRSAEKARTEGISCSINPTEEGLQKLNSVLRTYKVFDPKVVDQIEQALGPQKITVTGVPKDSRFARVLVAADYRMKRYGMKLEESPVKGMKSFVDMSSGRSGNMMPRWWMACNYDAVAKSEDGLAWQIRGQGVKTMTEEDFIHEDGTTEGTGRVDPIAQKWADGFTSNYGELSRKDPVFGELRNLMDMCVIGAIIQKEDLLEKAKCSVPLLTGEDDRLMLDSWNPAKSVPTQSSATKKGNNWIITASGGVQIESWAAAEKAEVDAGVSKVRENAAAADDAPWWWN